MILFELKCTKGHHFEAWFKDGSAFDKQAKSGEVECPVCFDTSVVKAPMAPAVSTSSRKKNNKLQGEHRAKEVAKEIIKAVNKLQKHVEDVISDKMLEGKFKNGGVIEIVLQKDELIFKNMGYVFHFNAIPQNDRDVAYWMKRTYEELYNE